MSWVGRITVDQISLIGISLRFEAVPCQESIVMVSTYFIRRPVTHVFAAYSSISFKNRLRILAREERTKSICLMVKIEEQVSPLQLVPQSANAAIPLTFLKVLRPGAPMYSSIESVCGLDV